MASIQYLLDRALVPSDYGDRLRAAGLNNGVAFGGSEVDLPDTLSASRLRIRAALSLNARVTPNDRHAVI